MQDDDEDEAALQRPQTAKDVGKLRESFANTLHLCSHFFRDRDLQLDLRMVSAATKPNMDEYKRVLSEQKCQDRVT